MQQLLQQGQVLGLKGSFLDMQQLELQARLLQLLLPVQAALDGSAKAAAAECMSNTGCGAAAYANGQQECDGCGNQTTDSSDITSSSQLHVAKSLHSLQPGCQQLDSALLHAALTGVRGFVQQLAAARSSQQEQRMQLLQDQQSKDADQLQQQLNGLWEAIPRGTVAYSPWRWAGDDLEDALDKLLLAEPSSSSSSSSSGSSITTRIGTQTNTGLPEARAVESDVPGVAGWASSSQLLSLLNQHSSNHHTQQQQWSNTSGLTGLLSAAESALCFQLGALLRLSRGLKTAATAMDHHKRCRTFYKQSQQELQGMEQKRNDLLSWQAKGQQLLPEEQQQLHCSEMFCATASTVQLLQDAGMEVVAEDGWRDKQQQWRAAIVELQEMVPLVGKLVTSVLLQLHGQQCVQQQQQHRMHAPYQQQRPDAKLQQRRPLDELERLDAAGRGIACSAGTLWRAALQFVDDADSAACREITAALAAASSIAKDSGSNCDGDCSNTCCCCDDSSTSRSRSSSMSCATLCSNTSSALHTTNTSSNSSTSERNSMWQERLQLFSDQVAASTKLRSSSATLDTSLGSIQPLLQAAASAGVLLLGSFGAFKGLGSTAVQLAELEADDDAAARQRGMSSSSRWDNVAGLAAAGKNGSCSSGACGYELLLPHALCNKQQQQWLLEQGQQLLDTPRQQLGAALLFVGGCYADDTTCQTSIPHHGGSRASAKHSAKCK
jgi:hypothetical protein